jgi:hypothetical protein
MEVKIYNQCSDFSLTDRRWFNIGADWNECPKRRVDTGNMMSAELMPFLSTFEGILTYKLRRKHDESVNRSESTYIGLVVVWKSEGYKDIRMCVHLIEHDRRFYWNGTKLKEYYQRYASQLCEYTGPIKDTWLTRDSIALMTRLELDFTKRDGILNITISEGIDDEHARNPVWIDPKM